MATKRTKDVYIEAPNGDKYYLDCVLDLTLNQTGTATRYVVESGATTSDHYNNEPDVVNINGVISGAKLINNSEFSTSLEKLTQGLTSLKRSSQPFKISFGMNLQPFRYAIFQSLVFKQTPETGLYAIEVSATVQRIFVASQIGITTTPVAAAQYQDMVETEKAGAGNTKVATNDEASIAKTQTALANTSGATAIGVNNY